MIEHDWNNARYLARLQAVLYLCQNYWRWCLEAPIGDNRYVPEDSGMFIEQDIVRAIRFNYPDCGSMPSNITEDLSASDLQKMTDVVEDIWLTRNERHVMTVDDILESLDWTFNKFDLEDYKIIYNEPNVPRFKSGKRKPR